MSAQVTEAHRELARRIMFEFTQTGTATASDVRMAAQLIADSEARACDQFCAEVERLKHGTVAQFKDAFIEELKRENAELRASCDEHAKGYVETRKRIATLETEIDRLHAINAVRESAIARAERAEDELDAQCLLNAKGSEREAVLLRRVDRMAKECLNIRADLDAIKAIRDEETARAERAEAELAAERELVRVLRDACESICEEWGKNHDANPIGAGQKMETLASKMLEDMEDAT